MSEPDGRRGGSPGHAADVVAGVPDGERELRGVEQDLELLDELDTQDQVPVFDRMHAGLDDALARTADTGADPGATPAQGHRGP